MKIKLRTKFPSGQNWSLELVVSSREFAIDIAKLEAEGFAGCPWFDGIYVINIDNPSRPHTITLVKLKPPETQIF